MRAPLRSTARPSAHSPGGCSRKSYVTAATAFLLKETPERRAELLNMLDQEWRRDFDQEIERQTAEAEDGRHG